SVSTTVGSPVYRYLLAAIALILSPLQMVHAAPTAESAIGYDVSYLDCDTPLPTTFGFALVNVNHGRPFTANPCFRGEVAWALSGQALLGGVDALHAQGVAQVGIYATTAHWAEITGASRSSSTVNAPFAGLPNWIPRLGPLDAAADHCVASESLTGGPVQMVQ